MQIEISMAIGFITGIEESYPRPHVLFHKACTGSNSTTPLTREEVDDPDMHMSFLNEGLSSPLLGSG